MLIRRWAAAIAAAALGAVLVPAPASAASTDRSSANRSLVEVLTSDGNKFDRNRRDYDIVTEAALAVVAAKPASPVGLLAQGDVALTAFLPNDFSLRLLTYELTGEWFATERATFRALASAAGIDTIETVLLYHVVPGVTIDARTALRSDDAPLTTAQGGTVTVDVLSKVIPVVQLRDADTDDVDPFLDIRSLDINRGNPQIAHGIVFVLRPVNLP